MDPDFPETPRPLPDVHDPTRNAADILPPEPVSPDDGAEQRDTPAAEQPRPPTDEPDPTDVPIWMS